ncbi:hypothetical protein QUC31_005950 [Theobroma cacao]
MIHMSTIQSSLIPGKGRVIGSEVLHLPSS